MELQKLIHRTVESFFGVEIQDSKTRLKDLQKNPYDLIELSFFLEDRLHIRFQKDEFDTARTVGQLCRIVEPILIKKGHKPAQPEKPKVQSIEKSARMKEQWWDKPRQLTDTSTRAHTRELFRKLFAESLKKQGLLEK